VSTGRGMIAVVIKKNDERWYNEVRNIYSYTRGGRKKKMEKESRLEKEKKKKTSTACFAA
jgi:hypothetical protein